MWKQVDKRVDQKATHRERLNSFGKIKFKLIILITAHEIYLGEYFPELHCDKLQIHVNMGLKSKELIFNFTQQSVFFTSI